MAPQIPQPCVIESESSQTMGASPNAPWADTQQQRRCKLVHRNAMFAATENKAQEAHFKVVRKIGRSNDSDQHAIEREYVNIDVAGARRAI